MDDSQTKKVKSFEDLTAWKAAREVRKYAYLIANKLPVSEKTNLVSQIKRAAVSITANIAEGYGRYHYQENIQYCRQSRGSLYEVKDHFITCLDENFITSEEYAKGEALMDTAARLLNGYISYLNRSKLT
jgi:four helix bundle protein